MPTVIHFLESARARLTESDAGDVPGWVLVTIMTAGLANAAKCGS